ncbi:hypothetical protein BDV40DRAFT_300409 [Aspergillus tamarii]|uniref:Uncharacterized protein n=1 Tax=Aspergillus tamarii TaxID=41984 RepID=A0A5N6UUR0_ASPTM|nr:hypothetical protein BDV40DRAFT_300409 [Aspergillus tamarii]
MPVERVDPHIAHTRDGPTPSANTTIHPEVLHELVEELNPDQPRDMIKRAGEEHSDVAAHIKGTIEEMGENQRHHVLNFDIAYRNISHTLFTECLELHPSLVSDVANLVYRQIRDTIRDIAKLCGPGRRLQTRLDRPLALRTIGTFICISIEHKVGHDIQVLFHFDPCLEESVMEILSTMSEERRAIREDESSERALWPHLVEFKDLALEHQLFHRFGDVLALIDLQGEGDGDRD